MIKRLDKDGFVYGFIKGATITCVVLTILLAAAEAL